MSNRASPRVAFGFDLGATDEIDITGIEQLIQASDDLEDGDWPVELIFHGHYEYRYCFVSVRGTRNRGADWGTVVPVSSVPPEADKIDAAKSWCESNNIPWQPMQWCAMAVYS